MIDAGYVKTMAAYNAVMNQKTYAGASQLSDADRRADQGAFFKSIHGTLNHILWADKMWMSRFDGWPTPPGAGKDSPSAIADFATLQTGRQAADQAIADWAERVPPAFLGGETIWVSGITQREMRAATGMLVVHMFNHQTHHRAQVHALLTRAGIDIGATDIWLVL